MKRIVNAFLGTLHGKTGRSVLSKRLGILGALAIMPAFAQMTAPQIPLTTLYSFAGGSDGATPYNEALVIGSGGELYGTTSAGGGSNYGTVFMLAPPGTGGGILSQLITDSGRTRNLVASSRLQSQASAQSSQAPGAKRCSMLSMAATAPFLKPAW
jgi:uncharacterized repeat protein (TIGR03803 family)